MVDLHYFIETKISYRHPAEYLENRYKAYYAKKNNFGKNLTKQLIVNLKIQ
jgi:tartrate dehydratase alpha subunit/fumarate hydratase class I-like protein